MKRVLLLIILFVLSGCVGITPPWETASNIPELVTNDIYRGPRPDYIMMEKYHIKTVMSLEDDKDIINRELLIVTSSPMNMKFVNFPMSDNPFSPPSVIKLIMGAFILDRTDKPVYIHCTRGIDRTGYIIATYRMVYQNWSFDKAYNEVINHGHSPIYFMLWKDNLKEIGDMTRIK